MTINRVYWKIVLETIVPIGYWLNYSIFCYCLQKGF